MTLRLAEHRPFDKIVRRHLLEELLHLQDTPLFHLQPEPMQ